VVPTERAPSFPGHRRRVPHTPDFLCSFVGSLNFLRLSLKKGAYVVLSRAAYRKFGASRSFFARCGIPQASPSSLCRAPHTHTGAPRLPERTWAEKDGRPQISYFALLARATCAALLKESRMKSINATGLHRKSGGSPQQPFVTDCTRFHEDRSSAVLIPLPDVPELPARFADGFPQ
jgi:hypothetical protein